MANAVTLTLKSDDGSIVEEINASFEASEIELLANYSGFVDRVRLTSLLQRGMPSITNISWQPENGMKFTCPAYSDDELHALLHVLRPLILSNEAASFQHISGLLGKRFESDNFRKLLKLQRTIFEDGELKLYMQISLNEQPLLADATLKLWLNSEQYHTDVEKSAIWKDIVNAISEENTRALVITQLQAKVKAIFNLQYVVNLILQKVGKNGPSSPDVKV